jgi:hypothetical protein
MCSLEPASNWNGKRGSCDKAIGEEGANVWSPAPADPVLTSLLLIVSSLPHPTFA